MVDRRKWQNTGTHLGPLWGPVWLHVFELCSLTLIFGDICWDSEKENENGAPQGWVDMQSDHAVACFVRVGRRRRGSILGSILESFREPSWPLYSFLVDLVAKMGLKKSIAKSCVSGDHYTI